MIIVQTKKIKSFSIFTSVTASFTQELFVPRKKIIGLKIQLY